MANKLHTDGRKSIYEIIGWIPNLQDTQDLIAGTKTITRTAEATGTGNADYSSGRTLSTVPYLNGVASTLEACRLQILQIAARLSVTIDSDDGTHDLRCSVYVDTQATANKLFDITCTATGAQLAVLQCYTGSNDTIFNLLKDGAAHIFYFFFWSPGNHSPVISVCRLHYGVGGAGATGGYCVLLTLKGSGWVRFGGVNTTSGTVGSMIGFYALFTDTLIAYITGGSSASSTNATLSSLNCSLIGGERIAMLGGAATDIAGVNSFALGLMREE
jgi:hypothetical protein